MSLLSVFLAIVGVLAGLRLWPILIHTAFWLTGLSKAEHEKTSPSEAFKKRVTRVVVATGCAWFALFAGIAALIGQESARPGSWVALFLGVALAPGVAIGGYFSALRRLKRKSQGQTDAANAKPKGRVRTFLKWCSSSLAGHIVLFQFFGVVPMFILGIYLNYTEGTLTFSWGVWIAFVAECFGIFMALFFWFTLSRWFVYLRRDTEAMKALLAKKHIKATPESDGDHSPMGEG